MFYKFICFLIRVVLFFVFRIEIVGEENIPKSTGGILAVNHRSNWDVTIIGGTCPKALRFMAKSELFENKLFGLILKKMGAFPIHRGKGDIVAIKAALTILKSGNVMLMFPEGKRVKPGDESIVEAKAGVAMLAIKAKVPVIPVYLSGTYKWMHKITVVYGKPVFYDEYYDKKLTMEQFQNLSNDMLKEMRSLKIENKK